MGNILKEAIEKSNQFQRKLVDENKTIVSKWEKTGLLEGIDHVYEKSSMAVLLENQAKELLSEISKTGGANAEEWSGVALPLVRRIFGDISSKEFVSVQPMTLPSGLVFYLDIKYGTAQPGFSTTAGTTNQGDSVFGITATSSNATAGLYGAGRFGYSINEYTATDTPVTASAETTVTWADVDYNAPLSASLSTLRKITINMAGTNFDPNGVRAFSITTGSLTYYPAYTKAVDFNGAASTSSVTFVVSETIESGSLCTVKYHKQPTATSRGDFEQSTSGSIASGNPGTVAEVLDIPELKVSLRSEPIVAKTRKLKAEWTPEFAQDLNAYHNIDAENVLTSMLSEYISMEIDLEVIDMLILNALTVDAWSAQIGTGVTAANTFAAVDFGASGNALAYNQQSWFATLGTKIQKVSNKIHQKTMRGGANFIVCGPDVASVIESIPGWSADTDGNASKFAMGAEVAGKLKNRWTVYKNPYMTENILLMGYRGAQFLEVGAAYCPFIPLIMSPLVYDPQNFTPRKAIMTRYAKKMLRSEFYGKVQIHGMNYV